MPASFFYLMTQTYPRTHPSIKPKFEFGGFGFEFGGFWREKREKQHGGAEKQSSTEKQ